MDVPVKPVWPGASSGSTPRAASEAPASTMPRACRASVERLEQSPPRLRVEPEHSRVEQLAAQARHLAGGPEQTGVTGDPTEAVGVRIVDLATQDVGAPGVRLPLLAGESAFVGVAPFGGSGVRKARLVDGVSHPFQPERLGDLVMEQAVQRVCRDALEDRSEQDVAQIGIDRSSGLLERQRGDLPQVTCRVAGMEIQRLPRRQTRSVGGQRGQADVGKSAPPQHIEVPGRRGTQVELPPLFQPRQQQSGHERFRQRSEIVRRRLEQRLDPRLGGRLTDRAVTHDAAGTLDAPDRSGNPALADAVGQKLTDRIAVGPAAQRPLVDSSMQRPTSSASASTRLACRPSIAGGCRVRTAERKARSSLASGSSSRTSRLSRWIRGAPAASRASR